MYQVLDDAGELWFSPPYGDGTMSNVTSMFSAEFSPPYGENPLSHGLRRASSPERGNLVQGKWQLEKLSLRESWRAAPERVLRGEVEIWYKNFDGMAKKFLSPYGDGTGTASAGGGACPVFAPLWRWYWNTGFLALCRQVFAPLRGWYLTGQQIPRLFHVFAPLRGSWRAAPEKVLRG